MTESAIQITFVTWFRLSYPKYWLLLFHVPNGGKRSKLAAYKFKREGVVPGVADLLLLVPNRHYPGLAIEVKTPKGRQSPAQKLWAGQVKAQGYKYIVIRSLDEFIKEINNYLSKENGQLET